MKYTRSVYYSVILVTVTAFTVFAVTFVRAAVYDFNDPSLPLPAQFATGMIAEATSDVPVASSSTPRSTAAGAIKKPVATPAINPLYPSRLLVPAIGINANVQDVGITAKGTVGTPNNFTDVGWYAYGPIPGDKGDAVIDGHVDNGLGLAGVFKKLSTIQTGDDIYVTNHAGKQIEFVVTNVSWYPYKDVPTDALFGSSTDMVDGKTILRLVTCGGTWVGGDRTYDERLVVTASLI